MTQTLILGWVKTKKKKRNENSGMMLRFLRAFPEGIMTPAGPRGPFRAGDLINVELVGEEVARVLIKRGAVEVARIRDRVRPGRRG